MLGDAVTHDRLVRELATGVGAAVAFVEYDRSPEARFPVAVEQAYATARWITGNGARYGLDSTRMAVAGDSAGGTSRPRWPSWQSSVATSPSSTSPCTTP